jgi:hypothetical protein
MKVHCKILLILTWMIIILNGCTRKCEDLNNEILDWMPFKIDDKIVLSRNNSSLETLTVDFNEINHSDRIPVMSMCICENSFIISLSSDSLDINILFHNTNKINQSWIYINGEQMNYSQHLNNLEVNGHMFTDLITYKNNDLTLSRRFEEIIISKSIGIISISAVNDEWLIVDDSEKQIEISDIKSIKSGCS